MYNPRFEKDVFKRDVRNNVKTLFRKEVEEATPQQLFQAVSYAVKEAIIDDWLATQKQYEKDDPKTVYYMSMEFLLGRALGNNLINMTAYKEVKEALEERIRSRIRHLVTVDSDVWQHVSWILLQHWDMHLMDAVSVTVMVCSSRRSETAIR